MKAGAYQRCALLSRKDYLKNLQAPVNSRIEQEKQFPAAQKKLFQELAHEEKQLERGFAKTSLNLPASAQSDSETDDATSIDKELKAMRERAKSVEASKAIVEPAEKADDDSKSVEKPSQAKKKQKTPPQPRTQETSANNVVITDNGSVALLVAV